MRRDSEQVLTEWLVLHAQSGSAEALEQLLRIWYPKLLRYAAAQLRDDEAAKDVVQEALLGIAKRIRRLRDPAAFPRWAYEILQRRGIDHVRRATRSRETARSEPEPYSGAAAPETVGDMEGRVSLETALTSLGADSYQVVHLRYLIGLSLKEIASILGIPEGTVKSRLHSARAQLRTYWRSKDMTDMNTKILEAIRTETEETLREYEEEKNIFGLIVESFKGTFKWTVIFAMLLMIVFAGAAVYCAINLFGEPDVAVKLNWLALGLAAFIVFVALRLWFFMELNRLSLKREIKRVELQVVLLANVLQREDPAGTA